MYIVNISIFVGILSLLLGFFLLFAPDALKKLNEFSAKMIQRIDTLAFSYRIGLGISLVLVSAFMFFMAYYFARKY